MLAIVRVVIGAALMLVLTAEVRAQVADHRLEVGLQYTALKLSVLDSVETGIGGRFGVRANRYLTVEGEFTFFPKSELGNSGIDQKSQALVGIKSGISNRLVGVFGKVRPGAMTFSSLKLLGGLCRISGETVVCTRDGLSGRKFALDVGAVVEVYPTTGVIIRADVGDTMIRFNDDTFFTLPFPTRVPDGFCHNLQVTVSVGLRF
jgi:hypothetical protein